MRDKQTLLCSFTHIFKYWIIKGNRIYTSLERYARLPRTNLIKQFYLSNNVLQNFTYVVT